MNAIDSADHVATFKWLFAGTEFPDRSQFQYVLAQLEVGQGFQAC